MRADGRINLLQVANAVAGYAYDENVAAIRETAQKVHDNVANEKDVALTQELLALTQELLKKLSQSADKSENKGKPLPTDSAKSCKDYDYNAPLTRRAPNPKISR